MGETERLAVVYSSRAIESITNLAIYLSTRGYPETAEKFCNKLYDFGDSLGKLPNKYALCRFKELSKYNLRCAIYKDWTFIYRIDIDKIMIFDVVHSSNLS